MNVMISFFSTILFKDDVDVGSSLDCGITNQTENKRGISIFFQYFLSILFQFSESKETFVLYYNDSIPPPNSVEMTKFALSSKKRTPHFPRPISQFRKRKTKPARASKRNILNYLENTTQQPQTNSTKKISLWRRYQEIIFEAELISKNYQKN
jgi:hypothetical protein